MIRNLYKASVFDAGYDYLRFSRGDERSSLRRSVLVSLFSRFESVNNPFEIPIDSNKPILDLLVEEVGALTIIFQ